MKEKKIVNKFYLFIVALSVLLNITANEALCDIGNNFQPVSSGRVSSILNMISGKTYANYESVKSWQGEIDATVSVIYFGNDAEKVYKEKINSEEKAPQKIKKQRESTVEFAADIENGSFYANKYHRKPLKYVEPNSGELLKSILVDGYNISIGTPDYKIISDVSAKKGDSLEYTAIKGERASLENCTSCKDDIFDPRNFLLTGQPIWKTFPLVIQFIEIHGSFSVDGRSLRVEERKDGGLTEYRIEIPGLVSPGECLLETMLFSSDNNFNVSSIEVRRADGKPFQKKTWEYIVIDGIYLPQKTTTENYDGENAELVYQRECMFSNQKVNQTIPPETFDISNLQLKDGDLFVDKIENKKFKYNLSTKSLDEISDK